jgi:hypothetical protein
MWDAELLHYTWLWGAEIIAGVLVIGYALTHLEPRAEGTF